MAHEHYIQACAEELGTVLHHLEAFEIALYQSESSREALQSLDSALIQQFDLSLQTLSLIRSALAHMALTGAAPLVPHMESFLDSAPLASVAERLRK